MIITNIWYIYDFAEGSTQNPKAGKIVDIHLGVLPLLHP